MNALIETGSDDVSDFGAALAAMMKDRQIGVRELARRSGYTASYISQLKAGLKQPSQDTAQDLDDTLAVDGKLAALAPQPRSARRQASAGAVFTDLATALSALPNGPLPAAAFSEREYGLLVQALSNWALHMKRRDLLAVLGAAATAAYASPLLQRLTPDQAERISLAAARPGRADEAIIGHIEAVMDHCMHQEDQLGPQVVLETAMAQRHLVQTLLPDADSALRPRMLSLLANISRFTGWVLFNLNDFNAASFYYGEARSAAHEADDDAMCSFVLANWSHLATWSGDPRLGVEHALGAVAWAQRAGSKLLVSYGLDVGARAYAAVVRRSASGRPDSDHSRCMDSLDQAHHELESAPDGDPGSRLVYFYGDGQYLATRSACLLDLERPAKAMAAGERSVTEINPAFPRNLALMRLALARAHVQTGDVATACDQIATAAELARRNSSPRLSSAVSAARKQLQPWQRTPAVAALDERLRAS